VVPRVYAPDLVADRTYYEPSGRRAEPFRGTHDGFGAKENGATIVAQVPMASWAETHYSAFLWYPSRPKEQPE
jgi:hypothetical protein